MKLSTLVALTLLGLASFAQGETTITLNGVHNCCKGCANGITKAAAGSKDTTVTAQGKTVTITAKSKSNAKKAAEAILEAGYYGTSDADSGSASESSSSRPAKAGKKLTAATVTGAHLCCQKCVDAVADAVKTVPGITGSDIVAKEKTFKVSGEFTEDELVAALNKAGFNGTVGR